MAEPGRTPAADRTHDTWRSALASRYTSRQMQELLSERARITRWRQLWILLAELEREQGLEIPLRHLKDLKKRIGEIDFDKAAKYEKEFRHDVMAHLHAFADLHPPARPFLHLGATSCFITDNADLLILRDGLHLVQDALISLIGQLATFAQKWRHLPTLGYTHFQPAQPTTVGKRACLWLQDLVFDHEELTRLIDWLPLRGVKGTTGTQASFLSLFDGSHQKVKALDREMARRLGFKRAFSVTGQTYPRKVDSRILQVLSGIGQSAAKAANDLRLLAHEREVEEPYAKSQIGSSAMAYKRNPMRAERMNSLARYLVQLGGNAAETASQQWLERTLDDSANRRLSLAEGLLTTDAILRVYQSIAQGLVVNEPIIKAHLDRELPFLCTEEILMQATKAGGDRQVLHERIRVHSRAAVERLKGGAADNDLLERLEGDEAFAVVHGRLDSILDPKKLVGRAPQQVQEFLRRDVEPLLRKSERRREMGDLDV